MNKIVKLITGDRDMRERILQHAKKAGTPLTQQAIDQWKYLRHGVPPRRVQIVARATGLEPNQIRPDIFPRNHQKN